MLDEPAPATPPSELVLDRYRPLRPLGSGGSGSVWLARDEHTGDSVALKIVRREGKAGLRAEREAAVAARLRHQRCLRAYAHGHDERYVYTAYEYAPGRTLREAIRSGDADDRTAVEAGAQILEALAHAHGRGVVHRDVKPSNVLLVDGEGVSVRLLDFGLAQVEDADTLTAAGDVPGTLAYIAPERLAGATAGPAADVWAVGVILWEALAGVHPFWTSSVLDTARAIEAGAPTLRTARPDLPTAVVGAVDRALSADPARRPPAAKLAAALRGAGERRGSRREEPPRPPNVDWRRLGGRVLAPALAALVAGWGAAVLPFYPHGWPLALAALAAAVTAVRERAGLAVALAVPVLPLGNFALAAALVYSAAAVLWLALAWREPRAGFLVALGPLLAPASLLGLLPLAAVLVRSPIRRAAVAGACVLAAALAAGLRRHPLPFTGEAPPLGLGLAGSERPLAVLSALGDALAAHPALAVEALALGAAAALVSFARQRGPWAIALLGGGLLAAALLPEPAVAALPLVGTTWAMCAALALTDRRT